MVKDKAKNDFIIRYKNRNHTPYIDLHEPLNL